MAVPGAAIAGNQGKVGWRTPGTYNITRNVTRHWHRHQRHD